MKNLKNNRYLPFIIIAVILIILVIVNIVTSKSERIYTKNDITFTFDTQFSYVENNVTVNDDATEQVNTYNTEEPEEIYYEDTEDDYEPDSNVGDEIVDEDTDDIEVDDESVTKLFTSKEQIENIALGYLNQGRKYRKFFETKELFEKRNEIPVYDCSVKSSNFKKNSVEVKCRQDGDDDSFQTINLKFKVENNKITDVVIE